MGANGSMVEESTLEEYMTWKDETEKAQKTKRAANTQEERQNFNAGKSPESFEKPDTGTSLMTRRNARLEAVRNALLETRQTEGDNDIFYDMAAYGIRHPYAFEQGPRLGSGVSYTYDVSKSRKYTVTTSINIGAAWNIFTAGLGIETTQEDEFSVKEGLTFNVDCDNQGQVTFYPYYEFYRVLFLPSQTEAEIYVPVDSGNKVVSGEIAVACLG